MEMTSVEIKAKIQELQGRAASITEKCRQEGRDYAVEVGIHNGDEGDFWMSELVTKATPPVEMTYFSEPEDLEKIIASMETE